jgi:hypothetical protein
MPGTRWIKVDATIVECFRAWEESRGAAQPWFEIVADIKTRPGQWNGSPRDRSWTLSPTVGARRIPVMSCRRNGTPRVASYGSTYAAMPGTTRS